MTPSTCTASSLSSSHCLAFAMVAQILSTTPAFLSYFTPNFHLSSSSSFAGHPSPVSVYPIPQRVSRTTHHGRVQISAAHPDVVIVGGGIAGLSTAFELARTGASVRILTSPTRRPAGLAAAGMLAPNSENLPPEMYALCKTSLHMYPSFLSTLRSYAPNHPVPLRAFDDFLIPSLDGQPLAPVSANASSRILSADQARLIEPALSSRVSAARAVSTDASVDNRRLWSALRAACLSLSVRIDECMVHRLIPASDQSYSVETDCGMIHASHILVAAGAWTHSLLPNIPVRSFKGQMLSLALPYNTQPTKPALQHVLYSDNIYIVPREEDRPCYYVGATVEPDDFSTNTTAAGVLSLLQSAVALVPSFEHYEIVETWAGLRPGTPDLAPVIGMTTLPNVSVASGFYRNGILLAPIIAKISSAIARGESASLPQELAQFLHTFSAGRFVESSFAAPSSQDVQTFVQQAQRSEPVPPSNSKDPLAVKSSVTTTEGDKRKPQLFKILKDGTREPIYPPAGWKPELRNKTEEPNESMGEKEHINGLNAYQSPEETSHHHKSPEADMFGASTKPTAKTEDTPVSLKTFSEDLKSRTGTKDDNSEHLETKGLNDAYDDILLKKDEGEDLHGRRARAANRAFGRKKSRLEKDGSPVLSLTDEEVDAFDAAFDTGLQDMKGFERFFDENDPGLLATKKDIALIDSAVLPSKDTPLSAIDSDQEGSTDQVGVNNVDLEGLSLDGYF